MRDIAGACRRGNQAPRLHREAGSSRLTNTASVKDPGWTQGGVWGPAWGRVPGYVEGDAQTSASLQTNVGPATNVRGDRTITIDGGLERRA